MTNRLIEPFQKGETDTFMKHAEEALELLVASPGALLVFSGWAFQWRLFRSRRKANRLTGVPPNNQRQNSPRHSHTLYETMARFIINTTGTEAGILTKDTEPCP
jgi:hypothetical protein